MQKNNYIPTTIIDGFLEYPEKFRDFALEQEYTASEDGRWPGVRSKPLHDTSPLIYNTYIQKILSIFFTASQTYNYDTTTQFQIVNENYESGWVHKDSCILTSILYLTPGSSSGTSLFRKKNIFFNDEMYSDNKVIGYKNSRDDYIAKNTNNENFEETLNVKGVYNRLLIFDSSIYHAAHDFFGTSNKDSRLTLVTFFNDISGTFITPLQRSRNILSPTVI
jgi:hypothetical protein